MAKQWPKAGDYIASRIGYGERKRVAQRAGINKKTLDDICSGLEHPKIETLMKLAQVAPIDFITALNLYDYKGDDFRRLANPGLVIVDNAAEALSEAERLNAAGKTLSARERIADVRAAFERYDLRVLPRRLLLQYAASLIQQIHYADWTFRQLDLASETGVLAAGPRGLSQNDKRPFPVYWRLLEEIGNERDEAGDTYRVIYHFWRTDTLHLLAVIGYAESACEALEAVLPRLLSPWRKYTAAKNLVLVRGRHGDFRDFETAMAKLDDIFQRHAENGLGKSDIGVAEDAKSRGWLDRALQEPRDRQRTRRAIDAWEQSRVNLAPNWELANATNVHPSATSDVNAHEALRSLRQQARLAMSNVLDATRQEKIGLFEKLEADASRIDAYRIADEAEEGLQELGVRPRKVA